jgi:hypothetical protein
MVFCLTRDASVPLGSGGFRAVFDKDYLEQLGGESKARLSLETSVSFRDENGVEQTANVSPGKAKGDGVLASQWRIADPGRKITYAFCYLRSEKAQKAYCHFGSDDDKVWVNGDLVYKNYRNRRCKVREDKFTIDLRKGLNAVMVKVAQRTQSWIFALEIYTPQDDARVTAKRLRDDKLRQFQRCKLSPRPGSGYVFAPGKFPEIQWERPYEVEALVGKFSLNVRWFDADLNEVTVPEESGRYAAVIEGTSPGGIHVMRAMTFYCRAEDWRPWQNIPKPHVPYLSGSGIDKKVTEGMKSHYWPVSNSSIS